VRSPLHGVGLVVLATVLFVTMNSAVKYLGAHLPTVELVWARTLAHLIFMVALFAPAHGGWRLFVTHRPGLHLARSLLLLVSTSLFFTALRYVPLAEATAVSFTSPFMVALLAGWVLRERVTRAHWLAIAVGFAGALLVIRPGMGAVNPYLFLVAGNAACYAGYQVLTRRAAAYDRPETSVSYDALVGTVLLSAIVPFFWQTPARAEHWVLLAVIGVLGGLGHYCGARALVATAASTLAPLYYVQLISAAALGYLLFGDVPSVWTWAGAALIVASGVVIAWWETLGRPPGGPGGSRGPGGRGGPGGPSRPPI
jgi:drug/metabolite transporter (DMT)-like permease